MDTFKSTLILLCNYAIPSNDILNQGLGDLILKKEIPYNFIDSTRKEYEALNTKMLKNIFEIYDQKSPIGFIYLSNNFFSSNILDKINFSKDLTYKMITLKNIDDLKNIDKVVLIAESGKVTFRNLAIINKYLSIYKNNIKGWIFINDYLKSDLLI